MRPHLLLVSFCVGLGCSSAESAPASSSDAGAGDGYVFEEGGADFDTGPVDTGTDEIAVDSGFDLSGLGKVGCVTDSVHFVGTKGDGSAWFDRSYSGFGSIVWGSSEARWKPRGFLSIHATDASSSTTTPFQAHGVLFMTDDAPDPGAVYCASGKTLVWETGASFVKDARVVLRSLVKAGNCGSGPVEPDVHVCGADYAYDATMDPSAAVDPICVPNQVHVVGSVGGAPIDGTGHLEQITTSGGPMVGWTGVLRMSDDGVVYASWTGDEKKGTGPGGLALPAKIDGKRTVLCADSVEFEDVPHAYRMKLVAPRRIGSCIGPTIDGQIEGCF